MSKIVASILAFVADKYGPAEAIRFMEFYSRLISIFERSPPAQDPKNYPSRPGDEVILAKHAARREEAKRRSALLKHNSD